MVRCESCETHLMEAYWKHGCNGVGVAGFGHGQQDDDQLPDRHHSVLPKAAHLQRLLQSLVIHADASACLFHTRSITSTHF